MISTFCCIPILKFARLNIFQVILNLLTVTFEGVYILLMIAFLYLANRCTLLDTVLTRS